MNVSLRTWLPCAVVLTAIASALSSTPAAAVMTNRFIMNNAVADCDPRSPGAENKLFRRATGIVNISDSVTFVTCSMQAQMEGSEHGPGSSLAAVSFINRSGADATVGCTMVTNHRFPDGHFGWAYYSKSMVVPATDPNLVWGHFMLFIASEEGGYFGDQINFSCALPPGVEIVATRHDYQEFTTP